MKMEESKIEGLEVIRKGVPFIMVLWEAVPSTAKEEGSACYHCRQPTIHGELILGS